LIEQHPHVGGPTSPVDETTSPVGGPTHPVDGPTSPGDGQLGLFFLKRNKTYKNKSKSHKNLFGRINFLLDA